jgi:hypothetical protein
MNIKSTYLRGSESYTKVGKEITNNKNLSIVEVGLMTKLLSYADKFILHKEVEQKKSGIGKDSFNKAWKRLEIEGFIRTEKNRIKGVYSYHYTVSNKPIPGKPNAANQEPNNSIHNTTDEIPLLENQRLKSSDDKPSDNIEINNIELNNQEYKNIEINNANVKNEEITGIEETELELCNSTKEVIEALKTDIATSKTSIQEQIKKKIREYVVNNKIHPFFIKNELDLIYGSDSFINNDSNCSVEDWFEFILANTSINELKNTYSNKSMYYRFIKKLDTHIISNNIDKDQAYTRSRSFFENHTLKNVTSITIDEMFKNIINHIRLWELNNTSNKVNVTDRQKSDKVIDDGIASDIFSTISLEAA